MKQYQQPSDIMVGVVGYGGAFNMGKAHLNAMQKAGMSPKAVAEIDPKRLELATVEFPGIETFSNLEAMLQHSEVDLVVLITPHNTHAKLGIEALEAGRHVVSEKPMAITTEECDAMIAAAEKNGVMLSTYHNRHWDGLPLTALKYIGEGAIGEVYKVDLRFGRQGKPGDWWRSSRTISGGVAYDWGVHLLEYALQIIDSDIVEVSGFAKEGYWAPHIAWKEDSNEDEASAVVRFASRAWLRLTITQLDADPRPGILEVTGTEGSMTFHEPSGTFTLTKNTPEGRVTTEAAQLPSAQEEYYKNIAEYLCGQAELIITPEWSRRPIHILDLAVQSAREGRSLPAKYV